MPMVGDFSVKEHRPGPVNDSRQNSTETGDLQVTPTAQRHFNGAAGGSRSSAPEEGDWGNFDEKSRTPSESVGACKSPSSGESSSVSPQLVDDDHPVTEKICCHISHKVGSSWKNLLRELDLNSATIEQLIANFNKDGVAEVCYQGLLIWLRNSGAEATYGKLREALDSPHVGRSHLLEQIPVNIV
ncbi:Receptor-interacting serine/threonine-protein kinase 1 [Stylophora pistillata]|uniref:Receptor-interacting serine/threonine-protein kinase 1 n=1 Tax=Stylophora pistillata TaxID=50429 RepID=A0A2B4RPE5_STYPI|nr:Receptor-interacting serine/threonine-protein kinase 1 [Stylophora pistillata]